MQLMLPRRRNALLLLAGFFASLASHPAAAQITNATPPGVITPLSTEPDVNKVNLTDGKIRIDVPTVGVPAAPRLNIDVVQDAMPYLVAKLGGSPVESSVSVHVGGASSASFSCTNDDVCNDRKAQGAALEGAIALGGSYTVTLAPSGAVYTFDRLSYDSGGVGTRTVIYYVSSVAYPDGEVITYTYDTANYPSGQGGLQFRVTRIASNIGYRIDFTYQGTDVNLPAWRTPATETLVQTSNPGVPLSQLTYNSSGSVTDLLGRGYICSGCDFRVGGSIELTNATVTLPGEASPAQTVSTVNYSVVSAVTRDGVSWNYAYANFRGASNPETYCYDSVTTTGPAGFNQRYNIQCGAPTRSNLITSVVDSIGRTTSYLYDLNMRPTKVTYPENNYVQIVYDKYGNITSKTAQPKPGSGLTALTESAAIDATACAGTRVLCYRITSSTDALSRVTNYAYDGAGRLIQRTDPADATGVRRATYMAYGGSFTSPTEVRVCALGVTCGTTSEYKTQYTYFGLTPLPLTRTVIDGVAGTSLTTTYSYDNAGRLLSEDGPLAGAGDALYYRYDILGRRTWKISAANASDARVVQRTTYRNADDRVTLVENGSVTDPNATTFTVTSQVDRSYDSRRYPVRTAIFSVGTKYSVSDRSFDDRGQPTCETARLNRAALPAVGSSACALGTAGAEGPDRIMQKSFDAAGQLTKVTKALGTADQADDATYTYSLNGKPLSLTDAKGNVMTLAWDGFDRQTRWTFPSPTTPGQVNAADYEAYGYDAAGNRISFRKRDNSTLGYTYDNLNRVTVKTVPARAGLPATHSRSVFYGYEIRGLQSYARFDSVGGEGVAMGYDGYGRLKSTSVTMDGVTRTLANSFDMGSNRNELSWPDGTKTSFAYDPANRMRGIYEGALGSTVNLESFAYDGLGRKTGQTGRYAQATSLGYDPVSRLSSLGHDLGGTASDVSWSFAYNPASQIGSLTRSNDTYAWTGHSNANKAYATNALNQYSNVAGAAFAYDADGNLTSDGSSTWLYDIENRLVSASGATTAGLRYDPLGRLYETSGFSGTSRFLYDGDELVAEYSSAGTLLRRYVHGSSVDDPVVWYEGAGRETRSMTVFGEVYGPGRSDVTGMSNPLRKNRSRNASEHVKRQ